MVIGSNFNVFGYCLSLLNGLLESPFKLNVTFKKLTFFQVRDWALFNNIETFGPPSGGARGVVVEVPVV